MLGAIELLIAWLLSPLPCPSGMVPAGATACIDELPIERLALSATREAYVDLRGATWNLEELCAKQGKRMCYDAEWSAACYGTPLETACPPIVDQYRPPRWGLVAARDKRELARLDRRSDAADYPSCVGRSGARMMGAIQEWVRTKRGYAFSRRFWSRAGTCSQFITSHAPDWHDYATGGRCCVDVR